MSLRLRSPEELLSELVGWVGEGSDSAPFVTLSYAQSLDGSIASGPGQRTRISGEESLILTHRLRAAHHAILVGIGTVVADDPLLTVRKASGESPIRIVLDSDLRIPVGSRLIASVDEAPVWVLAGSQADDRRRGALEARGARVMQIESSSWSTILSTLANAGVATLMVEGGGRVISSLLRARAFDAAVLTLGMRFLGGLSSLEGPLPAEVPLERVCCTVAGEDLVVAGRRG
ncbi:MAG: RibD family protein [Spirochaetaceae bacterium]